MKKIRKLIKTKKYFKNLLFLKAIKQNKKKRRIF